MEAKASLTSVIPVLIGAEAIPVLIGAEDSWLSWSVVLAKHCQVPSKLNMTPC